MKRRFSNILNLKKNKKGYQLLLLVFIVLIWANLFISCNRNTNGISDNSTSNISSPTSKANDSTQSKPLWDLPEKDEELAKRMSLRKFGASRPVIEFASENIAVIADYWGIAIYDLKKEQLCRVVDLISIGMSATQGDNPRNILVNKEGTHIIISKDFKLPGENTKNYLYNIEKDKLEATQKEEFENYADNRFTIYDEKVKKSLEGINLDGFSDVIAKIGTNKWMGIKHFDTGASFSDMRTLKICVIDDEKTICNQLFSKYNDLPPWPTEAEIIENHLSFLKEGERYVQCISFKGLSEEEVIKKFKKGTNWKFIESDGKVEKYMANINGYDVLIGIFATTNTNENTTNLNVIVY